jgi:hypothetical protein
MRRALGRLDGDALDAAVGAWLTDRLHTQRNHAAFLVACKQPGLHAQLLALPWREVPCWTGPATKAMAGSSSAP